MDVPIKVRRFMARIVLPSVRVGSQKLRSAGKRREPVLSQHPRITKKAASALAAAAFWGVVRQLEIKLQAELHPSRIMGMDKMQEIRAADAEGGIDCAAAAAARGAGTKLGVVEEERLPLKVEPCSLSEREALVEPKVKVETDREVYSVSALIASIVKEFKKIVSKRSGEASIE